MEKAIARRVFEHALHVELNEIMNEFKARVVAIEAPDQMWKLREFLERKEREIEEKYDYRYSQLAFVFARLLREERIQEEQLVGLAEDKRSVIRGIASR